MDLSSHQAGLLDFLNPQAHYPIFRVLCDALSIGDIVNLTRTCKQLSGLYRYLLPLL